MRGVPEFVIRAAVKECMVRIKQHIKQFIESRATSTSHVRDLTTLADTTLKGLEEELYAKVEERLWMFVQQT